MKRDLAALAESTFDLLIIGGGINGLATARDAAQRGLSVALIERGDFGSETSSHSYKIIHGGLRYLQHFDFKRMRESIDERTWFFRSLPHLIRPLPFLVPTYGHGMKGREAMAVAMKINDWMGRHRNRDIHPELHLPHGYTLSRKACLEKAPMIPEKGLSGGAVFFDGQMQHSDRVNLAFALSAFEDGAVLANYVEARSFLREGSRVEGVNARDCETGSEFPIKAKVVADMTGPWNQTLLEQDSTVTKNAGFQIIVPQVMDEPIGLAVISTYQDPDAKIKRGGRHYFATPWRGHTMFGTTDKVVTMDPDEWKIEQADIDQFVKELDQALPGIRLKPEDVVYAYGGLRPMGDGGGDEDDAALSRKPEITNHPDIENLLCIEGVKYTTCRLLAEHTVDAVYQKLDSDPSPCQTMDHLLAGGDFTSFAEELAKTGAQCPDVPEDELEDFVMSYGSKTVDVLSHFDGDLLSARIAYAVDQEMALHLRDVVLRRTGLGTLGAPEDAVISRCAARMGKLLGWSEEAVAAEIASVNAAYC